MSDEDLNVDCEALPVAYAPPVQVRLTDLLICAGFYALVMLFCSWLEPIRAYHFSAAFSLALFFFSLRILPKNRTSLEAGVLLAHGGAVLGHLILIGVILIEGGSYKMGRDFRGIEGVGFFAIAGCAVLTLITAPQVLVECLKAHRYGLGVYAMLGALPYGVDLVFLYYAAFNK